jgi:SAM-dependent methyltransferase
MSGDAGSKPASGDAAPKSAGGGANSGPVFDWAARYATGDTPWDKKEPHPELAARVAAGEVKARRIFVGGCGPGYDALLLARTGAHVTAIDIVPAAGTKLAPALRELGGEFLATDALAYTPKQPFDLVYEHTFFCALDLAQRPAWGEMVRRVLTPKGRVVIIGFPADKPVSEGGPPFRSATDDYAKSLGPEFRLVTDSPVQHRAQGREWQERWTVFDRA